MTLESILQQDNSSLFHSQEKTKDLAKNLLKEIKTLFPEFTNHDIEHSEEIIRILNEIIHDSLKEEMNCDEIYCILVAAYLHDIGMLEYEPILKQYKKQYDAFEITHRCPINSNNPLEIKKMFIRKYHHLCSEQIILHNWEKYKIEEFVFARAIAKISRGHRRSDYYNQSIFPVTLGKKNPINIPFLSALLALADELDVTYKRTPYIVWNYQRPTNPISLDHWTFHLSIHGVLPNPSNRTQLIINSYSNNDMDPQLRYKLIHALYEYQNKVRDLLSDLPNHLGVRFMDCHNQIPQTIVVKFDDRPISEVYREWWENNEKKTVGA